MKKILKISSAIILSSLFFINNSFAEEHFCEKKIYNSTLTRENLKDNNFIKNLNLNDKNTRENYIKFVKDCNSYRFMDYTNWNFLFTFYEWDKMIWLINDKIIFTKNFFLYNYLSKYGNHIISYYAPSDGSLSDKEINDMKDQAWFYIDWVKYSWFFKEKDWYNFDLIKSQDYVSLVYNYDFLNWYLTSKNDIVKRKQNWENLILNKNDLAKLYSALEDFLSKKENISKIDETIKKASEIKAKTPKTETKKIEILNYIQAELKIFQIKNKN